MKLCLLVFLCATLVVGSEPEVDRFLEQPSTSRDRLYVGEQLQRYGQLVSLNGKYAAFMQPDGNFAVYNTNTQQALWSTGTKGAGVTQLVLQDDGNLVVYGGDGNAVWDSDTNGDEAIYLVMQNDGNLVVRGATGQPLWATNTHGGKGDGTVSKQSSNDGKLVFVGIGDWGKPGSNQRAVASKMASWADKHGAQFVVALGDNFYEDGISSYRDKQVENTWRKVYDHSSLKKPWYAVLGNHDHHYNRAKYQVELARHDSRWIMPRTYYSFDKSFGSQTAHFIVLDTEVGHSGHDHAQLSWFKSELEHSKADWIFVCGHHPVFSTGEHGTFSHTKGMYNYFRPLMEQHKVALYMSGHDHLLEHLAKPSSRYLPEYVVSGSGSKLRSEDKQAVHDVKAKGVVIKMSKARYGFAGFVIDGDYVTVTYVDKGGSEFYKFTKKNPRT